MVHNSAIGLGKWNQPMIKFDGDEQTPKNKLTWLAVIALVFVLGAMTAGAVNAYMPAGTYVPMIYREEHPKKVKVYQNPFRMRYAVVSVKVFTDYHLIKVGDKVGITSNPGDYRSTRFFSNETCDPRDLRYEPIPVRTFVLMKEGMEIGRVSRW